MYGELIAEAIGTSDPAKVALVEELMRTDRTGLDGLTREGFIFEARVALLDALLLAAAGEMVSYCHAFGLEVPTFA